MNTYDINAGKKATNLTINADLLEKAKAYKINISQQFETYLAEVVRTEAESQWEKETQSAIDAFNARIHSSDIQRRF